MRLNVKIATIIVIVISAILCFSVSSIAEDTGVPLVGLSWHGQPCTNILVPEELPQEFISNADDIILENKKINKYLALLVFITGDYIITACATHDCPAFVSLGLYNIKTEIDKYWLYNIAGKFRKVTSEEHSKFENNMTQELMMSYCSD